MVNGILLCVFALITICAGYPSIAYLRRVVPSGKREYTPDTHTRKSQIPSLGGILFIPLLTVCGMIFAMWYHDLHHMLISGLLLSFMGIGVYDDISKLWYHKGVSERRKFILQVVCAILYAIIWYCDIGSNIIWHTPGGTWHIPSGIWCIPWAVFIIVGSSNAVNLTDGLDGLAATVLLWHAVTSVGIIAIVHGAGYSVIPGYTLWLASLAGVMLGFLWHNGYPARIFMGDVGSLSLGALCGGLALISGTEWFLPMTLIVPVIETISVIAQVISRRYFGVRIVRFAPIHHHFEMIGWHEVSIVTRAGIVTALAGMIAIIAAYYTV